jgi:prepilin peptidase CpaA
MSIIWLLFLAIGLYAAAIDLATYKIPNSAALALCFLFAVIASYRYSEVHWLGHLGAGAISLVVGIVLYLIWHMGAGDAKLFAAFALWAGFDSIIRLLFWVAVGGMFQLGVIYLLRRLVPVLQQYFPRLYGWRLPRVLVNKEAVPFGVGIVLGAVVASHWFPPWLWTV